MNCICISFSVWSDLYSSEFESVRDMERRLLSTQPSGGEYQRSLERLCCAIAKAHDLPSGAGDRKHVEGEGRM